MRVALIGSTGFIGQHVARWLTAGGHEVVGLVVAPDDPTRIVPAPDAASALSLPS